MITGAGVTRTASGVTSSRVHRDRVVGSKVCCLYGSTLLSENWVLVKGEQLPAATVHFGAFKEGAAARFLSLTELYGGDQVKGDEMG